MPKAPPRKPGETALAHIRRSIVTLGKYDPLMFAELAWPWMRKGTHLEKDDIRVWQSEVLDTMAQHLQNPETRHQPLFIAVASGHGIGKSAEIGMISTWALSCFDKPRVLVTANTENQLRTKTSPEIGQWVKTSVFGDQFDVDTLSIRLRSDPEQHRVDLTPWSETNTEAFQGLHAKGRIVLVIFDEASGIPPKIWEVVYGALTDADTVLIFIAFGNPTQAVGPFRDCFGKDRHRWKTWNIDSRTVEGTNKAALQAIVDKYGEDSDVARYRVRGLFPRTSNRQMVPEYLIDAAVGRHYRKDQYDFAPTILTCDPAWTGDDELVIGLRQGLVYKQLEVIPRNDNDMEIGAKLANYEVQHNVDQVFIDQGYGTGIYSYGLTIGRSWMLVPFGGAASKPGYRNKRAEMYAELVEWLRAGGALPVDQKLRDDLAGIETKPTPDGTIQLLSKEEMRAKGLPSPDRADALALSFAHPVVKRQVPISQLASRSGGQRPGGPVQGGYHHDAFS
jgi:hypothetical protein